MKNNNVVTNIAQDFTDAEKSQGRANIGAISSADLAGYATESWVAEQDYATESWTTEYVDSQTSGFTNVYLGSGGGYAPTYTPVDSMSFWVGGRVSTTYNGGASTEDQGYLSPWEVPEATSANFNKVLGWTPDGAQWVNGDVPDWIIRQSTMDGHLESTNPIYNQLIDGTGDAEEIWGEALVRFNTSGSYALCPADVNLNLTKADQSVNLKDLPAGVYSIGFLFQATNPGDVRYLQIKGQSEKTAADISLMHVQTSLKRAR
jgi:hypothetical protein